MRINAYSDSGRPNVFMLKQAGHREIRSGCTAVLLCTLNPRCSAEARSLEAHAVEMHQSFHREDRPPQEQPLGPVEDSDRPMGQAFRPLEGNDNPSGQNLTCVSA